MGGFRVRLDIVQVFTNRTFKYNDYVSTEGTSVGDLEIYIFFNQQYEL